MQNAPTTYFDVSVSKMTEGIEEWNKAAFLCFQKSE